MDDIRHFEKREPITRMESVAYSELTCRKCGRRQTMKGHIEYGVMPENWGTVSINSQGNLRAKDWQLCLSCLEQVRKAAGLSSL